MDQSKQIVGAVDESSHAQVFCSRFPESRAATEHLGRLESGRDYAVFPAFSELEIARPDYEAAARGVEVFIKVSARVAHLFSIGLQVDVGQIERSDRDRMAARVLHAFLNKTFFPFKAPELVKLLESASNPSLVGALFGSDSFMSSSGTRSVEVNFGPATGGILEQAALQRVASRRPPVSTDLIESLVVEGFNNYYKQTAASMRLAVVPVHERHIVIVENDGLYVATSRLAEVLRRVTGATVSVVPLEAVTMDSRSNRLMAPTQEGALKPIDQIVCDFYLEAAPQHVIVDALTRGRVIGVSSPIVDVLLAAKVVMGIAMTAVQAKNGALAGYLGISAEETAVLRDAFPETHLHGAAFFCQRVLKQHSIGMALESRVLSEFIAKSSDGGTYGGYDVFDLSDAGDVKAFRREVYRATLIMLEHCATQPSGRGHSPLGSHLVKFLGQDSCSRFVSAFAKHDRSQRSPYAEAFFECCHCALTGRKIDTVGLRVRDIEIVERFRQLRAQPGTCSKDAMSSLLRDFAAAALRPLGHSGQDIVEKGVHCLLDEIARQSYLPFLFQRRIDVDAATEVRFNGICDETRAAYITGHARVTILEGRRAASSLEIEGLRPAETNRHLHPASRFLELELDRVPDELLLLPEERRFERAVVLMSGTGRHVRALAPRAAEVVAVDLSSPYLIESERLCREKGLRHIEHVQAEVLSYLRSQSAGAADLVAVMGNSLIYLEPRVVRELLMESSRVLGPGGVLAFDVVDLGRYAQALRANPVSSLSMPDPESGVSFRRVVARELLPHQDDAFMELRNLGIYLEGRVESMHEDGSLYIPKPDALDGMLRGCGFNVVRIHPMESDFPLLNMMRTRLAVLASRE